MNEQLWNLVQWSPTVAIWVWVITGWGVHRWLVPSLRPEPLNASVIRVEVERPIQVTRIKHKDVAELGAQKGKSKPGDRVVVLVFSKVSWWKPLTWMLPARTAAMYVYDANNQPYTLKHAGGVSKAGVLRQLRSKTEMYSPEYVTHIVEVADGRSPWSPR